MKVELEYGHDGLVVNLPDDLDVHIIRKHSLPVLPDEASTVLDALRQPVSCLPLAELARGRRSACILICDITRPVPNRIFLQPMIREIMRAGVLADGITLLVATGLHRPNLGEELAALTGDAWVMDTVKVENHYARDSAAHVDLGRTTTRGTPVKLDRRFVEADLRIVTGLVEPHFMAGYSGGRKVVAPGVAHEDTIRTFHSARFMEDPLAAPCNLAGNPLHEEQLEIIRMLGDVYAVNTVIDDQRRLVHINFGEVIDSHAMAVAFAEASSTVSLDRRFNTLLTSSAGYPLDKTYYQTVKGMVTPLDIMQEQGNLIIASACSEGLGSNDFVKSLERLHEQGAETFLKLMLARDLADIDEWQTEMLLKTLRKVNVQLYSRGLKSDDKHLTGVQVVESVEKAVMDSVAQSNDPLVAIIPEGPYVVPGFNSA